jgi:hypothetical protein
VGRGRTDAHIGKAKCLRERVGLPLGFGRADAVLHYGGRPLWHVERFEQLLVAWRPGSVSPQ